MKILSILIVFYLQLFPLLSKDLTQKSQSKVSSKLKAFKSTEIIATQDTLLIAEGDLIAQSVMSDFMDMSIIHDKQGFTWITTDNNSIYRYDNSSLKQFQMAFSHEHFRNLLFVSQNGTLWVARTYTRDNKWKASINEFDRQTEKFKSYIIPVDTSLINNSHGQTKIIALSEDNSGKLWIIWNVGIYLLDLKTSTYNYLPLPGRPNTNKEVYTSIQVFVKGIDGEMWIGTNRGLYKYHKGIFNHYRHDPSDTTSLIHNDIVGLHLNRSGELWIEPNVSWEDSINKNQGLNKFIPASGRLMRILSKPHFPHLSGWNHKTGKAINYHYDEYVYKELVEEITDIENTPPTHDRSSDYWRPIILGIRLIYPFLSIPLLIIIILSFAYYRSRIKQVRQKANFDKQIAEVSMMALRAQMNPHFLFNSLNSINHYIVKNKPEEAAEYLTKFSRLIRLILTNSKLAVVPLAKEIEAVRLYIQLESIRFNNQFDYNIELEEGVDVNYIEIPPLLIQPYVENSIWHGLLHKEEKGHLKLLLYIQDPFLFVIVEDNGIGRKKAQEQKSKSATKDKSMGMQITAERVDMLNQLKQQQATVEIIDMEDQEGNPTGTKVILRIPI